MTKKCDCIYGQNGKCPEAACDRSLWNSEMDCPSWWKPTNMSVIDLEKDTPQDACPACGALFPTDDRLDFIPVEEIKFCYHCGERVKG